MRYLATLLVLAILGLALDRPVTADEADKNWATLKGQVVFDGDPLPAVAELKVTKDEKHCLDKGKLHSEAWVVDKDSKGVKNAFVYLMPEPGSDKALPIHPSLKDAKVKEVEIDQPCCAFVPHCLAVREGQTLVVKNSSPVPHNVRWQGQRGVNESSSVIVPAGKSHKVEGLRAQRLPVPIACDIHPWMNGWVRIFDHPYFALTDAKGNFEIAHAPAGEWRLVVWHEEGGLHKGEVKNPGEKITIKGGSVQDLGKLSVKPRK